MRAMKKEIDGSSGSAWCPLY